MTPFSDGLQATKQLLFCTMFLFTSFIFDVLYFDVLYFGVNICDGFNLLWVFFTLFFEW